MNRIPRFPWRAARHAQWRRGALVCLSAALLALSAAGNARAATWRVAADGLQSFVTIQDALDFSSPGDTVLVGAGRYEAGRWIPTPMGPLWAVGSLEHDDVVLRGVDRSQVVLGPAQPPAAGTSQTGLVVAAGTSGQRIENLTLENLGQAVWGSGNFTVNDVTFRHCSSGVEVLDVTDLLLERCTFDGLPRGVDAYSSQRIWVRDCSFGGGGGGVFAHSVHGWARVERCAMLDVAWGVEAQAGSVLEVLDTEIQASLAAVILTSGHVHATLAGNRLAGGDVTLEVGETCTVEGTRNVFHPGSYATLLFQASAGAHLTDNHIFLQASNSVWLKNYGSAPPTVRLDLTGNYWGSATEAQIAARVWDGVDDPAMNAFVDFLPIAGTPVPDNTVSFGRLKADFGAQ